MGKTTGYEVCQQMVEVIEAEISSLKANQRARMRGDSLHGPVHALANACAKLQGELRKTADDADRAVQNLPPERRTELILRLIDDLSPEYRAAIGVYLEEKGVGLM